MLLVAAEKMAKLPKPRARRKNRHLPRCVRQWRDFRRCWVIIVTYGLLEKEEDKVTRKSRNVENSWKRLWEWLWRDQQKTFEIMQGIIMGKLMVFVPSAEIFYYHDLLMSFLAHCFRLKNISYPPSGIYYLINENENKIAQFYIGQIHGRNSVWWPQSFQDFNKRIKIRE